jgi:hypothetical protein
VPPFSLTKSKESGASEKILHESAMRLNGKDFVPQRPPKGDVLNAKRSFVSLNISMDWSDCKPMTFFVKNVDKIR